MYSIEIRDLSNNVVPLPAGVDVSIESMSRMAAGGDEIAEASAVGPADGLWALLRLAGHRVKIRNERGSIVWRGYIEEVLVAVGGMQIGVSLKDMANRVKVIYSSARGSGYEQAETDWAEDADSVARYGAFELRYSAGDATLAQAQSQRDTLLSQRSKPVPIVRGGAGGGEMSAQIHMVGDWFRLATRYYSQAAGLVSHEPEHSETTPVGLGFTSSNVAFVAVDGLNMIHQVFGRFKQFRSGMWVRVTGSASNNGTFEVKEVDGKDAASYTAATISFDPADDIRDSAGGLGFLAVNDVITISGSASNNGTDLVKTISPTAIEISPGYGGTIVTESAGASVTILRGNSIKVGSALTNELVGASVTVVALGQRLYQTFTFPVSGSWPMAVVELRVRKVGSPADSLTVRLTADSGGSPGSVLATATMAAADIATETEWVRFTMSSPPTGSYGNTYGIEIFRSGSDDNDNFFEVEMDPDASYAGGAMKWYDGASWQTPSPAKDLVFRVVGQVDTTVQLANIVAGNSWFSGSDAPALSGVDTDLYRDGANTGLAEAEQLLAAGTVSGRRLLASMLDNSVMQIVEQEPSTDIDLYLQADGTVLNAAGRPLEPGVLPAGKWVHLAEVPPSVSRWAQVSPIFIERATLDVRTGMLRLEPQSERSVWDIGLIANR